MNTIIFKNWQFFTEKSENWRIYQNHNFTPCECLYCQNFEAYKDKVFPKEYLELFENLGIDYRKYSEIMHITSENDLHLYGGWFHFKGKFARIDAENQVNIEVVHMETIRLTDHFSLGFYYDDSLSFFPPSETLVEAYFEVKIPWVLHEFP